MYVVLNNQHLTIVSQNSLEYADFRAAGLTDLFTGSERECNTYVDELKEELAYEPGGEYSI